MTDKREGWTHLYNAYKWHYFRNYESLCKKWMILSDAALEQGMNQSPDNCAMCMRKILGEQNANRTALTPDSV